MTTRKRLAVNGELLEEKGGWKKIHIYGEPYDRGYAHGVLLYKELKKAKEVLKTIAREYCDMNLTDYLKKSNDAIYPIVKSKYPEFFRELEGISAGARRKGVSFSVERLIAWNACMSLYNVDTPQRCSAFIATGSATKTGEIVMAHNTHCDYFIGHHFNIILKITPSSGVEFTMQAAAGYIASSTDWFMCANGIIGCETTIGDFKKEPRFSKSGGAPYFCRIRQAMQYANTLDEYCSTMIENNAGDYACSWLFGDTKTNEILILELGLDVHKINRTSDGVYYSANSVFDLKLRNLETDDNDHDNVEESSGARNVRLDYLLNDKYYGKLDTKISKQIISDHYDVMFHKDNMSSRTVCAHFEDDESCDCAPYGCMDAKVTDANMAKTMSFDGRYGSGCGRVFKVSQFIKANPEYKKWASVMRDIKKFEWVRL
jgi:hypothetical protein